MSEYNYEIDYEPRNPQEQIHNAIDTHRFVVTVAHRRMGKTVAAIIELIRKALVCEKKQPRFAYIAPTYAQAKRVAWDYLINFTRPLGDTKINNSELRIDFYDRRISLYGSENADYLRGQYFDGVIIDEVGDQNPKIWNEIVRPGLADREGWCLFIGTPKGQNHFKDLRDRAEAQDDWKLLEFKASQTKLLKDSELASAKREMGLEKYNQEFECSFNAAVTGSYYGEIINDLEKQGRMVNIERDDVCKTVASWDLGISDSTSIWICQIANNEVRLLDYHENHGVGLDSYINWLRENGWFHVEQLLPHDVEVRELGTGKSRLEILRSAGLDCKVISRLSVADGIQAVRRMLPKCWFNYPKTKQGIDSLRNYRREYNEKQKVFFDKPLHDWTSHCADSFRYLAVGLNNTSEEWSKPLKVDLGWVV